MLETYVVGKAGELMVMAKLLLLGHRVAQELVDDGTDIVLGNGLKIQVKTTNVFRKNEKQILQIGIGTTRKSRINGVIDYHSYAKKADYLIVCSIITDEYFIIPREVAVGHKTLSISPGNKNGLYKYKDKWELLII